MMLLVKIFGVVYKATNLTNNKVYIGQSVCLKARKSEHKKKSKSSNNKLPFYRAINRDGWDNFEWSILSYCLTQKELDIMEDWYIVTYNSMNRNYGYNLKRGGIGGKLGIESRLKISNSLKGHTPWNKGVTGYKSIRRKGIFKHSADHNNKKGRKGRIPWNKGKSNIFSIESKEKFVRSRKEYYNNNPDAMAIRQSKVNCSKIMNKLLDSFGNY